MKEPHAVLTLMVAESLLMWWIIGQVSLVRKKLLLTRHQNVAEHFTAI